MISKTVLIFEKQIIATIKYAHVHLLILIVNSVIIIRLINTDNIIV